MEQDIDRRCAEALVELLPRLMKAVVHRVKSRNPTAPLTFPQFHVLRHLARGECLCSELAKHLQVTTPTITSVIDGLVDRGLVQRKRDPSDRRAVLLGLTPDGRHLYSTLSQSAEEVVLELISSLSQEQKDQLAGILVELQWGVEARLSIEGTMEGTTCEGRPRSA